MQGQKPEANQPKQQKQQKQHNQQSEPIQSSQPVESSQPLESNQQQWQDDEGNEEEFESFDQNEQQSEPISLSSQQKPQQQGNGCAHYKRQCLVEAPCCKIFYPCKLCHDEKYQYKKGCQTQRMAFDKVEQIKCLKCELVQKPSEFCQNQKCKIQFGKYSCLKCMLYENNDKKVNDIFHCDDCKMCRRGTKESTFHCHKCGYCRPICDLNKHKCNENVAQSQCPICLEVLKYSTKYYMSLPCGHLIHNVCMQGLTDINCPVCGMAMQKMSAQQNAHIQQLIDSTKDKLPEQVKNHKVNILCNECLHKTNDAPFHFYGIKCGNCGTFNTKMI